MKNKTDRKRILLYLNTALLVGGCIFATFYIYKVLNGSSIHGKNINRIFISGAALLSLAYAAFFAIGWHLITKFVGFALTPRMSAAIWGMSVLGKYVPTGLAGYAYRTTAYLLYNETRPQLVVLGISIETAASILGGLISTLLAMAWLGMEAMQTQFSTSTIMIATIFIGAGATFFLWRPVRSRLFRIARLEQVIDQVDHKTFAILVGYYGLAWLVIGASFWMVCQAFGITQPSVYHCIAIYGIAGLSGIIAIFTPSGIGVREGVITALLSPYAPLELALAVALAARLISLLGDAGIIMFGAIVFRFNKIPEPR